MTADTEDLKVLLSLKEDLVTTESFPLESIRDLIISRQENIEEHVYLKKSTRIGCSNEQSIHVMLFKYTCSSIFS